MSILGSGSVHVAQRYAKKPAKTATAANVVCQKCLQPGHWTYECKNAAVYQVRPSRTKQLKDPKRRQAFMDPNQLLPEWQAAAKKKQKKESSSDSSSSSSSRSSSDDSDSDSSSSSSSDSSSTSGSDSSNLNNTSSSGASSSSSSGDSSSHSSDISSSDSSSSSSSSSSDSSLSSDSDSDSSDSSGGNQAKKSRVRAKKSSHSKAKMRAKNSLGAHKPARKYSAEASLRQPDGKAEGLRPREGRPRLSNERSRACGAPKAERGVDRHSTQGIQKAEGNSAGQRHGAADRKRHRSLDKHARRRDSEGSPGLDRWQMA